MIGERLATLDPETGKRPTSRIGHAGNARTLVQRLKYEDETRMYRYTRIQGLLDGNPPWPQKKLVDLGQGHRANFNLREGEGIVDSAKTPYYDLVFEVPFFAQITFHIPGADFNVLTEWGDIASDEYYETLCGWGGFDQNIQLHQWQMIVNGVGPLFWPHAISWHSQATKCRKVLVPQETMANVDELEICVVLHSWRADELESFISGAGDEEEFNGWNVPLCRKAIIDSAYRETRQVWGIENYDLYQRAIRTGDLFYGIHRSSRVNVFSLFTKEFGGKVSHYVGTDTPLSNEPAYEGSEDEVGYLYKRKGKFEGFDQVICPFFFDTGPDGTWHSVKGLGPKIFDFCDVSNRTFCQMLDGAVIGSGLTLEAQDGAALEETQVALIGGATVVQPGYKVVQTRVAEAINGAMVMRKELQNTLQSNTGTYRQRVAAEEEEPTLGQAQMNWQQQAILSKGATNRYYTNLDKFHKETLRRLIDPAQNERVPGGREAKAFVARCILRGIPEEVLRMKNIFKVRAMRSVGYGSPQLRDMATRELVGMISMMDEVSRNHALRMRAAALPGIGQAGVDAVFPKIEESGVPNAHTSFAVMENNALRDLDGKALVEPQQNHSIHFDVHMADVMGHVQEQQQGQGQNGAGPMDLLRHFEQAGPHLAQHLQLLTGDPTRKDEVKKKQEDLAKLGKLTDQLTQQIEEAMRAQQKEQANAEKQGQPDPELQAKLAKVHGELGLKAEKLKGDMAIKARKQMVDEKLKDSRTAAEIRRSDKRVASEINRGTAKTSAELQHGKAKTAADLRQGQVKTAADLQADAIKTSAEIRKAGMEMRTKEATTRADIHTKAVSARADIARKKFEAENKPKPQPGTQPEGE